MPTETAIKVDASVSGYSLFQRPNRMLSIMPQSASIVYDLLTSAANQDGCCSLSIAQISAIARQCHRTTQRLIKRLVGAHLITILERGNGRGRTTFYFIRAFATAPKKPEIEESQSQSFFSQERVTPPLRTPLEESYNPLFETQRRPSSRKIMFNVRCVVKTNASLTPETQKIIVNTVGRVVFKSKKPVQITYPILNDLINVFSQRRPPGLKNQAVASRKLYAWTMGLVQSIIAKHELGIDGLLSALSERVTAKGDTLMQAPTLGYYSDRRPCGKPARKEAVMVETETDLEQLLRDRERQVGPGQLINQRSLSEYVKEEEKRK